MASLRHIALVLTGLAAPLGTAMAACPQALAVYGSARGDLEIGFSGPPGPADSMLHRFDLAFAGSGVTMEGVVMLAGGPDRPWGIVMHDCPEGDATGAEIAACTVWQGPIYAISDKGGVAWLPVPSSSQTSQAASENLLLPDFTAALMQSAAFEANQITSLPGDSFRLKACQE
ncbi:hypothetical protein HPDFL43_17795 [Hoeflea phototrophica DFL-43]|jgi:hypothetical protein|uniref:Uncharacterized protein n=1 Tax=Hoeflea phototrophica (strain DSM 17068 / NCIMB 14078 / DFL-43) TaxID=411684 RepID=A9DG11_HOEPD|nr:hypothetical protein [Hoeflea phototrophica]EDQ31695.1 hypothetical protein HPDFL43_17795 [Hoeflea phototrophica DFL-43]